MLLFVGPGSIISDAASRIAWICRLYALFWVRHGQHGSVPGAASITVEIPLCGRNRQRRELMLEQEKVEEEAFDATKRMVVSIPSNNRKQQRRSSISTEWSMKDDGTSVCFLFFSGFLQDMRIKKQTGRSKKNSCLLAVEH